MDTQTVPVQAIVALFGILLTIISGLILWVLTKLATETKDTKVAITALEDKMNTELDKKPGSVEMNLRFDGVEETLKRIETMIPKLNQVAEDLAFMKGRKEARRELSKK